MENVGKTSVGRFCQRVVQVSAISSAILALLTQGNAYGLQLRNELDARLRREKSTNVGQIYKSLDRLLESELIVQSELTHDGLPLYALTQSGRAAALQWLVSPQIEERNQWEAMVVQVMIARSLVGVESETLVLSFQTLWQNRLLAAQEAFAHDVSSDLRSSADEQLSLAALSWLNRVRETSDSGWALSTIRPVRGRPAASAGR